MKTPARLFALPESDDLDDLRVKVATLEAQQRLLMVKVATLEAAASQRVDDAEWLATVRVAIRGHSFTVSELLDHARDDVALRYVLAGMSAHAIGVRLRRLHRPWSRSSRSGVFSLRCRR